MSLSIYILFNIFLPSYQFLRLTEWGTRLPMVSFPFRSQRSGSLPSHSWPPPSGRKRETESRLSFFLIKFSLVPWYKTSGLGCKLPLKRNYKMLHFSENQTKQGKTNGRKLNRQLVERVGEGKKKKIKIKSRHLTQSYNRQLAKIYAFWLYFSVGQFERKY